LWFCLGLTDFDKSLQHSKALPSFGKKPWRWVKPVYFIVFFNDIVGLQSLVPGGVDQHFRREEANEDPSYFPPCLVGEQQERRIPPFGYVKMYGCPNSKTDCDYAGLEDSRRSSRRGVGDPVIPCRLV
jgi:hypothetical protein